jgi:hypothetical protein
MGEQPRLSFLPINSPPVSLRLTAKRGIVSGLDAAAWFAFEMIP